MKLVRKAQQGTSIKQYTFDPLRTLKQKTNNTIVKKLKPSYSPSTFAGEISQITNVGNPKVIDTISTLIGGPYTAAMDLGRDLNRAMHGEAGIKDLVEDASHFIPLKKWFKISNKINLSKEVPRYVLNKTNALYNTIIKGVRIKDDYDDGFSQYSKE